MILRDGEGELEISVHEVEPPTSSVETRTVARKSPGRMDVGGNLAA